jgi:hypothetical protein
MRAGEIDVIAEALGMTELGADVGRVIAGIGAVTLDRPGVFTAR